MFVINLITRTKGTLQQEKEIDRFGTIYYAKKFSLLREPDHSLLLCKMPLHACEPVVIQKQLILNNNKLSHNLCFLPM